MNIIVGVILLSIVVCFLVYPAFVLSGRISRKEEEREWMNKH